MKKCVNVSFVYFLAAMAAGVFYREFTKFQGFTGKTSLGLVHGHLLVLGTGLFLLLALWNQSSDLEGQKRFKTFFVLYNIALPFLAVMIVVRGVAQVLGTPLSRGMSAAISGMAGIAHILMAVSLFLLFSLLKKSLDK